MSQQDRSDGGLGSMPMPELKSVEDMAMSMVAKMTEIRKEKEAGKPIVWLTSVTLPQEILIAMDVPAICQDSIAGWVGVFQQSGYFCQIAEGMGVSRDNCSIHRVGIGLNCAEDRGDFFDTAFVPPDIILSTTLPCTPNARSFHILAQRFNCPYYLVDSPINKWGTKIPDYAIDYYASQLKGLIRFLEDQGFTMDWEKLKKQTQITKELFQLLQEIDTYRKATPTPVRAFDSYLASIGPVSLPKNEETVGLYVRLRDEIKERVEKGIGVLENEKIRLLWMGQPPVCNFGFLDFPEKYDAVIVKSMTEFVFEANCPTERIDPEKPLESLALIALSNPINPLYETMVKQLVKQVKEYRIDGVLSGVQRNCILMAGLQRMAKDAIYKETGVPSCIFDFEVTDNREYTEEGAKETLEPFFETLMDAKNKKLAAETHN